MATKESIHKSWQKFLAPLAGAAITALGVYATAKAVYITHDAGKATARTNTVKLMGSKYSSS